MRKSIFITQVTDGCSVMEGMEAKQGSIMKIWISAAQEEHRGPCNECDARCNDTGRTTGEVTGHEGLGRIKTQLLTSFAAALLDPFGVRDVVVTSFAVVKCSKISNSECLLAPNIRFWWQVARVAGQGALDYLFTSLASLAIKNPSVPSCILTWFPGLMRMLGIQRQTQCANELLHVRLLMQTTR